MHHTEAAATAGGRVGRGQAAALVAVGVLFWFLGAMFVRFTAPTGLLTGLAGLVVYALTVPCAFLMVATARRLAALRPDQVVTGIAVASVAAMVCDGVALNWLPALYGAREGGDLLPGAAWLLWGAAFCFVAALVGGRTQHRPKG